MMRDCLSVYCRDESFVWLFVSKRVLEDPPLERIGVYSSRDTPGQDTASWQARLDDPFRFL